MHLCMTTKYACTCLFFLADLQAENKALREIIEKLDARLSKLEIYRKEEAGLSGK